MNAASAPPAPDTVDHPEAPGKVATGGHVDSGHRLTASIDECSGGEAGRRAGPCHRRGVAPPSTSMRRGRRGPRGPEAVRGRASRSPHVGRPAMGRTSPVRTPGRRPRSRWVGRPLPDDTETPAPAKARAQRRQPATLSGDGRPATMKAPGSCPVPHQRRVVGLPPAPAHLHCVPASMTRPPRLWSPDWGMLSSGFWRRTSPTGCGSTRPGAMVSRTSSVPSRPRHIAISATVRGRTGAAEARSIVFWSP